MRNNSIHMIASAAVLVIIASTIVSCQAPAQADVANGINSAASNMANGMTMTIDRTAQPGIIRSAVRGVGNLAKNMTTSTGRLVGDVAKSVIDYGRRTGSIAMNAIRGTTNRAMNPRPKAPINVRFNMPQQQGAIDNGQQVSSSSTNNAAAVDTTDAPLDDKAANAPVELTKSS